MIIKTLFKLFLKAGKGNQVLEVKINDVCVFLLSIGYLILHKKSSNQRYKQKIKVILLESRN